MTDPDHEQVTQTRRAVPAAAIVRHAIVIVALACTTQGCGTSDTASTAPSDPFMIGATASIISSNGRDGLLEVELLLDDVRLASQSSSVPLTSHSFNTDPRQITPGQHTLRVRVVRQAINPTSWDVRIIGSVLNARTGSPQYFLMPGNIATARLENGKSVSLPFEIVPSPAP